MPMPCHEQCTGAVTVSNVITIIIAANSLFFVGVVSIVKLIQWQSSPLLCRRNSNNHQHNELCGATLSIIVVGLFACFYYFPLHQLSILRYKYNPLGSERL